MTESCGENCRYALANDARFEAIREDLRDLKARVARLETTLARGVLLLVANLAGVAMSLAQQILRA